jgi:hypothetical protein
MNVFSKDILSYTRDSDKTYMQSGKYESWYFKQPNPFLDNNTF